MDTPLRILILEDNSVDAGLIEFEIEEAGILFHSKVVASEQDFIKSIQDFSPDIILSDYDLRGYTGAAALEEANRRCPDVPFILVTGAVTEDRAIDILTSGAKDFVMKHRLKKLGPSIKRAVAEAEEHKARKKAEDELRNAKENLEVLVEERSRQLKEELNERKRVEEALRQSEHILRSFFDATGDMRGIVDVVASNDVRHVEANEVLGAFYGLRPEKVRGKLGSELGDPNEVLRMWIDHYERSRHTGESSSFEYLDKRENKEAWLQVTVDHVGINQHGQPRFAYVVRDITDQKKTEQSLLQSELRERERAEELAAILDAVPTPVYIAHDPECRHITGNRAADELIRNPRGGEASLSASNDTRPRHFKVLKDGRELSTDELPAQRAARGFEVRDFDCSFVFDDGTTRDVVAYGTPLLDADGSSRGSVVVFVDITERKRHEEILQKAKNELYVRSLIEASLDPLVTISPEGKITDVNEATEHVTGRKRHELIGTDFSDYFTDPDAARAGYRKVLSDGQVRDYPLTISDASGKRTDVLYHATVYRDTQGQVQGVFAAARDVTERRRINEAVKAKRQRRIKRTAGADGR